MAVSFKSTKAVPLEPSTPLLANTVHAGEGPASSVRCSESSANRPVLAGAPTSLAERSLVTFTANAPVTLSLQQQPAVVGPTSLSNRTWQERIRICSPCFQEMPLPTTSLMVTANTQPSSDRKTAEVPSTSTTRSGLRFPSCNIEIGLAASQRIPHTAGSIKERIADPDYHASAPSSPDQTTRGALHSLPCFRPPHSQWPFTAISEIEHLKLPTPGTSDACFLNRTQESIPQIPGDLVSAPPFALQNPHDSDQSRDNAKQLGCGNSLELCGVDNNTEAAISVGSAASRVGTRESMAAKCNRSPQSSSSPSYEHLSLPEAYLPVASVPLAAHANPVSSCAKA